MPAREQAGEGELQRLGLADDDAVELRQDGGEPLYDGHVGLAKRADGHWRIRLVGARVLYWEGPL